MIEIRCCHKVIQRALSRVQRMVLHIRWSMHWIHANGWLIRWHPHSLAAPHSFSLAGYRVWGLGRVLLALAADALMLALLMLVLLWSQYHNDYVRMKAHPTQNRIVETFLARNETQQWFCKGSLPPFRLLAGGGWLDGMGLSLTTGDVFAMNTMMTTRRRRWQWWWCKLVMELHARWLAGVEIWQNQQRQQQQRLLCQFYRTEDCGGILCQSGIYFHFATLPHLLHYLSLCQQNTFFFIAVWRYCNPPQWNAAEAAVRSGYMVSTCDELQRKWDIRVMLFIRTTTRRGGRMVFVCLMFHLGFMYV